MTKRQMITDEHLIKEWMYEVDKNNERVYPLRTTLQEYATGSNKRCKWRGECGHEWYTSISQRTLRKSGCPECKAKQAVASRLANQAKQNPLPQILYNDWMYPVDDTCLHDINARQNPEDYSAQSNQRILWKCKCGNQWAVTISSRLRPGRTQGCPKCGAAQALAKRKRDYALRKPMLKAIADEWLYPVDEEGVRDMTRLQKSTDYSASSNLKAMWKCHCGNRWVTSPNKRASGRGCPACSRIKGDRNRMLAAAAKNPMPERLCREWVHVIDLNQRKISNNPREYSASSKARVLWKCEKTTCNTQWEAFIYSRPAEGGCPGCAIHGFNPSAIGYFYFIFNPISSIAKIGISNYPKNRLAIHRRNGYTDVLLEQQFQFGHDARKIETKTLRFIRNKLSLLIPDDAPQDGKSEAFSLQGDNGKNQQMILDFIHTNS